MLQDSLNQLILPELSTSSCVLLRWRGGVGGGGVSTSSSWTAPLSALPSTVDGLETDYQVQWDQAFKHTVLEEKKSTVPHAEEWLQKRENNMMQLGGNDFQA
jgi:hypothetical protein